MISGWIDFMGARTRFGGRQRHNSTITVELRNVEVALGRMQNVSQRGPGLRPRQQRRERRDSAVALQADVRDSKCSDTKGGEKRV